MIQKILLVLSKKNYSVILTSFIKFTKFCLEMTYVCTHASDCLQWQLFKYLADLLLLNFGVLVVTYALSVI